MKTNPMRPMLHGARSRSGDRLRFRLTRAGGKLVGAALIAPKVASAAIVIACHIAIAAMSGWQEAQQATLNPQPRRRERQP